jgi:hypothetical protein
MDALQISYTTSPEAWRSIILEHSRVIHLAAARKRRFISIADQESSSRGAERAIVDVDRKASCDTWKSAPSTLVETLVAAALVAAALATWSLYWA